MIVPNENRKLIFNHFLYLIGFNWVGAYDLFKRHFISEAFLRDKSPQSTVTLGRMPKDTDN